MADKTVSNDKLIRLFHSTFDDGDQVSKTQRNDIRLFFAPGRVNLIGEHTDYTGGYVFPAALTFGTWAVVRARDDGKYQFASTGFSGVVSCHRANIVYKEEDDWANYAKGVVKEWAAYVAKRPELGTVENVLTGADVLFHGNIPHGAGLSSSASIEMVTAVTLMNLASLSVPMIDLVRLAQRAENNFVGVNCGIMDQFAVGMGKKDHAVLLKCDTMNYEYVPLRLGDYRIVVTHTNKRRGLADSKYNERRRECEQGLVQVQHHLPHIDRLGDLRQTEWVSIRDNIPAGTVRKRVEHVVSENERVRSAVTRLRDHDLVSFGQLMYKSHESLRDLYDVTGVELDALFSAARNVDGCIGSRMTGAGFGGCTVSLVRKDKLDAFQRSVSQSYTAQTGLIPDFYVCHIGDGAKEITES